MTSKTVTHFLQLVISPHEGGSSLDALCAPCERTGSQRSCSRLLVPSKLDVTCSASRCGSAWYLEARTLVSIRQSTVLFPCLSDVNVCDQVDALSVWLLELQRWTCSPPLTHVGHTIEARNELLSRPATEIWGVFVTQQNPAHYHCFTIYLTHSF